MNLTYGILNKISQYKKTHTFGFTYVRFKKQATLEFRHTCLVGKAIKKNKEGVNTKIMVNYMESKRQ